MNEPVRFGTLNTSVQLPGDPGQVLVMSGLGYAKIVRHKDSGTVIRLMGANELRRYRTRVFLRRAWSRLFYGPWRDND